MKNQDHRDTDKTGASLKAKLRQQIDETPEILPREPNTSTPLGCKIILWIAAAMVLLVIFYAFMLIRYSPYAQ